MPGLPQHRYITTVHVLIAYTTNHSNPHLIRPINNALGWLEAFKLQSRSESSRPSMVVCSSPNTRNARDQRACPVQEVCIILSNNGIVVVTGTIELYFEKPKNNQFGADLCDFSEQLWILCSRETLE
jgi:hypothetical protein